MFCASDLQCPDPCFLQVHWRFNSQRTLQKQENFGHSSAQHRESDGAIIVKIEILLNSMKYGKPREAGKGRDVIC